MERDFRETHFLQLTVRESLVFERLHLDFFAFYGLSRSVRRESDKKEDRLNGKRNVPSLLESSQRSMAKA
jgi:hypothetical protein